MATKSAGEPDGPKVPEPRNNTLLLGQEAAETTVMKALAGGRMTHAWMLTGPRGIGKATLAFRMARLILSGALEAGGASEGQGGAGLFGDAIPAPSPQERASLAPSPQERASLAMDPDHPVFHRIAAGSHADLRVIERGYSDDKRTRRRDDILIGDVRGIGGFLSLTPAEGGWRVVIIDAADEMNRNAANAVLKVLEEPPRRAALLLVAHNPARLPATIPSRCRALPMRPLDPGTVGTLLDHYRPDLDGRARETLVALSRGSIGRALDLAHQDGLALYDDLLALMQAAPRMDVARCHALGDKVARDEGAWRLLRELITGWLARLTRYGVLGGVGRNDALPPGEDAVLARLSSAAPLDRWVAVWEKTVHLLGRTDAVNLDRKQAVLAVLLLIERAAARA